MQYLFQLCNEQINQAHYTSIRTVWPHHATLILVPGENGSSKMPLFLVVPLRLQHGDRITVLSLVQLYSTIRTCTTNETYDTDVAHCMVQNYAANSKRSRNYFISEKYKTVKLFELLFFSGCICFKIFPLCQHTLLPATVKVMQTFLEAILLKPFRYSIAFLMMSLASQNRRPFNFLFRSREQVKISCSHYSREDIPVM